MLEQVVGEMIEGIAILDRLCSLIDKVSPFKLQIRELLNAFLGDVQVVTDFEIERIRLLAQFHAVMDRIWKANPKVDIYIVAHSEGTVVTFLALLKAFKEYEPRSTGNEGAVRLDQAGQRPDDHRLADRGAYDPLARTLEGLSEREGRGRSLEACLPMEARYPTRSGSSGGIITTTATRSPTG